MKRLVGFIIAACITMSSSAQINRLTGTWTGSINPGLSLVFRISTDSTGNLTAKLDSPDQGAKGIPCSAVVNNGDSIRVEIAVAQASYLGKFINDSAIAGNWVQGGGALPLNIKKGSTKRPQTPKPPFDYLAEDVEYDNQQKTVHFGGTLTRPKGNGKFPVVLLISGSGQQDRDETFASHKPFAVVADYLTKKGIAVLRVDDRGVGKSTGEVKTVTSEDFAKDVETSLAYLKTRPDININQIGLIGHSEGGIIAPMVAAQNKEVSFIILWGAPVIGGAEINTAQNGVVLQNDGFTHAYVSAFKQLNNAALAVLKKAADTATLHVGITKVFDEWRSQQPDSVLKRLYVNGYNIIGQNAFTMYDGLYTSPWLRFFITHDFAADLAKVKCPVLAINGTLDTQVEADTNLRMIDSVLSKNNHRNYKVVPLKGLNHLLQTATTGSLNEYATIEETIAPAALELMASWINDTLNSKRK